LVIFLVGQLVAIGVGGASIIAYYVKMETRVSIMETRGAEYSVVRMTKMEERITVLEQDLKKHDEQLKRVVDALTRNLGIPAPRP
jgi:hypothetical protein